MDNQREQHGTTAGCDHRVRSVWWCGSDVGRQTVGCVIFFPKHKHTKCDFCGREWITYEKMAQVAKNLMCAKSAPAPAHKT